MKIYFLLHLPNEDNNIYYTHVHNEPLFTNEKKKVQVGKDQEKAQSEKDSQSKKPRWEKTKLQSGTYNMKTYRKPNGQLFSQ